METQFRRFLSLALAIIMVIGMVPVNVVHAEELEGEPHEHSYEAAVTAPTCTDAGFTTYTCSCGDSYTADEVDALGHSYENGKCACGEMDPEHVHSYESAVTAPTCTVNGFTTYTCVCGDTYTADEVTASGHSYENGKCACGEMDPEHVHSYESTVTAPTCTVNGFTTYTCVCGDSYTADEVTASGHSYENGKCACGEADPNYGVVLTSGEDDEIIDTEEELVAAIAEGGKIELGDDIALTKTLTVTGTVTLDLNGYTLSHTTDAAKHHEMIRNEGNLTITGDGKISFAYTGEGDPDFGWGSYTVSNYGTLVVENSTIEILSDLNGNGSAIHMYCAIHQGGSAKSTTIKGGTISNPTYRSVRINNGKLYIQGGTFEGQVWMQPSDNNTSITIEGGSFAPRGVDGSSVYVENNAKTVGLNVTGGTFSTKIGAANASALAGSVTGGTFAAAAQTGTNALLFGEGMEFNEQGELVADTTIDTAEKLSAAIAAAAAGDTITLGGDITTSGTIVINKAITLDGNGKKLTATDASSNCRAINVREADGVTIKNLTIEAAGERAVNVIQNATNVLIQDCTITANNYAVNAAASAPNTVITVKNSNLTGLNVVNIGAAGAQVTITGGSILCNDKTDVEDYGALTLNKDAVGGSISATNVAFCILDNSSKAVNQAEGGSITIDGSSADVVKDVAIIDYGNNYWYGFSSLEAAIAKAKDGDTVRLLADVTTATPIVINKAITLDGNGKKLIATDSSVNCRAINVREADGVTIKNLTIEAAGERAVNVIQNATNVLIQDCTITANNYAVNAAASAPNTVITVKNSNLTGLNVVNIGAAGAQVTITGGSILCNDKTDVEDYGALTLNKDAVGGSISATNVAFCILDNSSKAVNQAEGGTITIDGSAADVVKDVAIIDYGNNYWYGFPTLEAAIAKAKAGDTVKLLCDITASSIITINKGITLDGNGKKLTSTASRAINVETEGNVVISDLTIIAGERAVNIINEPANVTLNKVTATANNNAVMLATSAAGADLTIKDSDLTGLAVVNVASADSEVVITDTKITNVDANKDENYGAITVWDSAENASVTVSGGEIIVADDSRKAYIFPASATVTGVDDIGRVVAMIGDAGYDTLQEAIDDAKADQTVELVYDITLTEGVTVAKDASVTLDLNGKTVSMSVAATKASALITNNGTLTIKDTVGGGKLTYVSSTVSTGYSTSTIINNGTLTVDGGSIENTSAKGGAAYAIDNYCALTVNGGSMSANGTSIRQAQFGNHDNTVIFNGGETSGYAGLQLHVFSTAKKTTTEINGGTFNGDYAMYTTFYKAEDSGNTEIDINGGTFNGSSAALFLYNSKTGAAEFDAEVKGGTFNGGVYSYIKNADGETVNLPVIAGGTFSEEVDMTICAPGFLPVLNEDGTYSVKFFAASIGDTLYETLEEAIAHAEDGEIKLMTDLTLTEGVTVAKDASVTLDLNGKTVSMSVAATKASALITNNGTLTIKDTVGGGKLTYVSSTVNTGYSTSTIINNGTLTVDGGSIENTSAKGGAAYAIDNYCALTVNGGSISANSTSIRQAQFGNHDNTVIFNGGETSGYAGLQLHVFSTAKKTTTEINGGTFNGDYAMFTYFYKAEDAGNTDITINGGTFTGDAALYLYNGHNSGAAFNARVNGGAFNGEVYCYVKDADGNAVNLPVIAGGIFSAPVDETICAEGFIPTQNGDGTYGVKAGSYDASVSIEIIDNYVALEVGDTYVLDTIIKPANLADKVVWTVEGEETDIIDAGIIDVAQDGTVKAVAEGTDYVLATVEDEDGNKAVARCRVDVTYSGLKITDVLLSTNKLTTELFSAKYAELDVILLLEQNDPNKAKPAMFSLRRTNIPVDSSDISIENAKFANDTMNELFALDIVDDRTLVIRPTPAAVQAGLENPKSISSAYRDKILLTIRGEEIEAGELTLTVKKTMPKIKASVSAFNSFYTEQTRAISFSGATVTSISEATLPEWLTLNGLELALTDGKAPVKSTSGKAYLKVKTEEWVIDANVSLTVKNTYKTRALKLSSTSVTICNDITNSNGFALTLKPSSTKYTLADLMVSDIEVPEGYTIVSFNKETGAMVLMADKQFSSESIYVNVLFSDTDAKLPLRLKIKQVPVQITMTPNNVKLNTLIDDVVTVKIKATPADYRIEAAELSLTDRKGKPVAEGFDKLTYSFDPATETVTIRTTETSAPNEVYYLYATAGGDATRMKVQTIGKAPSMTLKAKGSIDLSFPEATAASITATMTNCNETDVKFSVTVTDKAKNDVTAAFNVDATGNPFVITAKDAVATGTYTARVTAILNEGEEDQITIGKTVSFTVKRTAVKMKLSATKVSLNKTMGDTASVGATCVTKGYAFEKPVLTYDENALKVEYADGKLNISLLKGAQYGKTYKVYVRAHEGAPAATLSVSVLKASTNIKSTIKASGSVDVIRDNTRITITPKYTNVLNLNGANTELLIYSNANKDNYRTPIAKEDLPFVITPNDNGTFTLAANDKLNSNIKYKAALVTTFGEGENAIVIGSPKISLSVRMGSAKLRLTPGRTNKLYARDINSRVEFSIASSDAAVNDINFVQLVESKLSKSYRGIFRVIDYGNGEFAIGFVPGANISKVAGKTITLTLNTFVDGNVTSKTNATLKLKITVVK